MAKSHQTYVFLVQYGDSYALAMLLNMHGRIPLRSQSTHLIVAWLQCLSINNDFHGLRHHTPTTMQFVYRLPGYKSTLQHSSRMNEQDAQHYTQPIQELQGVQGLGVVILTTGLQQ